MAAPPPGPPPRRGGVVPGPAGPSPPPASRTRGGRTDQRRSSSAKGAPAADGPGPLPDGNPSPAAAPGARRPPGSGREGGSGRPGRSGGGEGPPPRDGWRKPAGRGIRPTPDRCSTPRPSPIIIPEAGLGRWDHAKTPARGRRPSSGCRLRPGEAGQTPTREPRSAREELLSSRPPRQGPAAPGLLVSACRPLRGPFRPCVSSASWRRTGPGDGGLWNGPLCAILSRQAAFAKGRAGMDKPPYEAEFRNERARMTGGTPLIRRTNRLPAILYNW